MNNYRKNSPRQLIVPMYLGLLTLALLIIVSLHVNRYMSFRKIEQSAVESRLLFQKTIIGKFFNDLAGDCLFFARSSSAVGPLPDALDILFRSKPQYRSVSFFDFKGDSVLHIQSGEQDAYFQESLPVPFLQRLKLMSFNHILLEHGKSNTAALWVDPVAPVLEVWVRGGENTRAPGDSYFIRITVDMTVLTGLLFPEDKNDLFHHFLVTSEGVVISLKGQSNTLPPPLVLQSVLQSPAGSQWIDGALVGSIRIALNSSNSLSGVRFLSDVYNLVSVLPGSAEEAQQDRQLFIYILWFLTAAILLFPISMLAARAMVHKEEAEGRLFESLRLQSAMLRTLPDSIFHLGEDEVLDAVQVHPETNRILRVHDFPAALDKVFPGDLSYKIRYYRNIVLDLEREAWFEYRYDGDRGFFYEFRFVMSGEGEIILIIRNRTEEREQQRRLYTASQFLDAYRQATDASSLVAKTDREGRLVYMNEHFRIRFAPDFTGAVGRDLVSIMNPVNSSSPVAEDSSLPAPLNQLSGMIHCRSYDGTDYYLDNTLLPISDETGAVQEIISFGHDVTELRNALEQARSAEHARASFIARMSHEMRTPLNCIIGFAEAAQEARDLASTGRYSRMILDESGNLLDLINQVLDFSKIEAGKLKTHSEAFHLPALLEAAVESQRDSAEKKGLTLTLKIDDDFPAYVTGDLLRIRQVLNNLLSNSIKFTDRGEVSLCVAALNTDAGGSLLRFEVKDTGIGIPEDMQQYIFDSFFQADAGDNRRYGGTGLGTTIARQLVELMDGSIAFESTPGQGSRFWFDLYLKNAGDRGDDFVPLTPGADDGVPDLRGRLILIVEDYRPNAEVLQIFLKPTGAVILFAVDGASAVERYINEKPDMVFMDIHMPELNGYEATVLIREHEKEHKLSAAMVIGVTANAFPRDIRRCYDSGMDQVLVKPLRKSELYTSLKKALSGVSESAGGIPAAAVSAGKTASSAPIDAEALLAELEENSALRQQLIGGFLSALAEQLDIIQEALRRRLWKDLHREVHSIKGAAATLFAEPLREAALHLEQAAKEENEEVILNVYPHFLAEVETLRIYLVSNGFLPDEKVSSGIHNS